jgi:predicted metal-dependent phosphoesterase TrpH
MKNLVDLHLHSTASDGGHSPSELVRMCLDRGLRYIALTDHDTTGGIQEALDVAWGTDLTVIPGVEISTEADGPNEIHMLGYHIDYQCEGLQKRLARLRKSRYDRAHKVLDLLAQNGCPVSWQRVSSLAGTGSIGRPHIAQAMVEAQYVESVEMAFQRYLGRGAPAYVARVKMLPAEAIQLILDSGGVPVLAHPSMIIEHVPALVRDGLQGIEAYYHGYPAPEVDHIVGIAQKHGIVVTGGTDFHGVGITSALEPGAVYVPESVVDALQACRQRRPIPQDSLLATSSST